MVLDHPVHVGRDAALIALVQPLEGAVVARARGGYEGIVGVFGTGPSRGRRGKRGYGPLLLVFTPAASIPVGVRRKIRTVAFI
jgi:hypothetical protein